jgi:S1-C subfamily serine protease
VLVAVNGKPVANSSAVLNTIAVLRPGDEATLGLIRDQSEITVRIIAGTRPKPAIPR